MIVKIDLNHSVWGEDVAASKRTINSDQDEFFNQSP